MLRNRRTRLALKVPIDNHTEVTDPALSGSAYPSRLPSNLAFDTLLITEPEPILSLMEIGIKTGKEQRLRSF